MVGFGEIVCPEPLGLETLAACLNGHEVKILDLRVEGGLEAEVKSFQPLIVGVSGYTTAVPSVHRICQTVKAIDPQIVTVVGGYHASLVPEDFDRDWVDVVALGEGEGTIGDVVSAVEKGVDWAWVKGIAYRNEGRQVQSARRLLLKNLDETPIPRRDLVARNLRHYHFHFWDQPASVETARGCPFRCNFCAVWKFHRGKCRFKSPERVMEELKGLDPEAGIVCFVDDNFLTDIGRAEKIGKLINQEGYQARYWMQARADSIVRNPKVIKQWADLGLATVLVGFEKFREEELGRLNKKGSVKINESCMAILKEYGVEIWGAFIVNPDWKRPDFEALGDYVRSNNIHFPQFTVLTPLPGTAFYERQRSHLTTDDYEVFDFLHSVLPTRLPPEEFYENLARLYATCTLSLADLKEMIRSGKISRSALLRVKGLLDSVTDPQAYLRSQGETKVLV
jgi:radical SAM superfamily enzyme YgiQ (UPF0313 family)